MEHPPPSDRPTTKAKQRALLAVLIDRVDRRKITWAELSTELKILRSELYNRSLRPRGRTVSPPAWRIAPEVRAYYLNDPSVGQEQLSRIYGVSIGRINEILNGKRT